MADITVPILMEIKRERLRQVEKFGDQSHLPNFPDNASSMASYFDIPPAHLAKSICDDDSKDGTSNWATILLEEFCEAMEETAVATLLREELIQVAAVAVAWVEAIDRRAAGGVRPTDPQLPGIESVGAMIRREGEAARRVLEQEMLEGKHRLPKMLP